MWAGSLKSLVIVADSGSVVTTEKSMVESLEITPLIRHMWKHNLQKIMECHERLACVTEAEAIVYEYVMNM